MHRYTPASGALQRTKGRSQGATSTAAPTPLQTVTGCKSMLLTILSHALALRRTVPPTAYAHPHLLRTPLLRQRVAKRMRRRRHAPPKLQVHPATTTRRDCVDCTHCGTLSPRPFASSQVRRQQPKLLPACGEGRRTKKHKSIVSTRPFRPQSLNISVRRNFCANIAQNLTASQRCLTSILEGRETRSQGITLSTRTTETRMLKSRSGVRHVTSTSSATPADT